MWMGEEIHDKGLREKIKLRVAGKVDVQLGKNGVTQGFIEEVRLRLRKHGVVKIRVLKSYRRSEGFDIHRLAEEIAGLTGGKIYEVRGFTITLIRGGEDG